MIRRSALIAVTVFGLSSDARSRHQDPDIDGSQTVRLVSRIPCDGYTAPEDHASVKAAFSDGGWERSFQVMTFRKATCKVDLKVKCVGSQPDGWREEWSIRSSAAERTGNLSLTSCYEWGQKEPAQHMLVGWYQEGGPDRKLPWKQAAVKQVSTNPDVFEFSDPKGGTARLEITRR
jgi:hypothetical protein